MYLVTNFILIIICIFLYKFTNKFKKTSRLYLNKFTFLILFMFLISFFLGFFFFFRFLNLFRIINVINLDAFLLNLNYFDKSTLFLCLIVLFFFVKLFVFLLKLSFLKIHYYLMNRENFYFFDLYTIYFYKIVFFPSKVFEKKIIKNFLERPFYNFFAVYWSTIFLLFLFFYDCFFNNRELVFFCNFLPFYSFYILLFRVFNFCYNLNFNFDIGITMVLYPLDFECEYHMYYDGNQEITNKVFSGIFPKGYKLVLDDFSELRSYINTFLLR